MFIKGTIIVILILSKRAPIKKMAFFIDDFVLAIRQMDEWNNEQEQKLRRSLKNEYNRVLEYDPATKEIRMKCLLSDLESNFMFLRDSNLEMFVKAYLAISLNDGWDSLPILPNEEFSSANRKITTAINNSYGHSGASFGWTLRHINFLAVNGLTKFKHLFIKGPE